jgi:hypothetical protein
MNSWKGSACYPRRTFCPLSDGDSTFYHRITWTYFRICSTCVSHSEAPIYPYARRASANRAEGTFVLLRYSFGGNRPSQTDPQPLSPVPLQGSGLEFSTSKGGVSSSAQPSPREGLRSLPLTLSIQVKNPVTAYSKGARGLSVLLQEGGIFTAITTSLSFSLRQSSTRYTIRAGRNLPDKEFRYLRTVIVTADIHWDLRSELRHYC